MPENKKTALLIDGNAMIHRVWHVLPPMHDPKGRLVNAAYGFTSILMKLLPSTHPDYLVVCWDTPEPTYRHEAAPEYKAQREEQPQEFYDQIPMSQELVEVFGGKNAELPGYEADDLLATLATRMAAQGIEVSILTSDRDIWQLIGPHIKVISFQKGVSETMTIDEDYVKETLGFSPKQMIDYKAMRGDASDNLKGIPGVGEKTATELLQRFGNLEAILSAAQDETVELSSAVRRKLVEGTAAARATYPLVVLQADAPIEKKIDVWKREEPEASKVETMLLSYGFKSLAARLNSKGGNGKSAKAKTASLEVDGEVKNPKKKKVDVVLAQVKSGSSERVKLNSADQAKTEIEILSGKEIVVWPVVAEQASLLAENTGLVLGTKEKLYFLPTSLISQKGVTEVLKQVLSDEQTLKISHDLKTVLHWCEGKGFQFSGLSFDVDIVAYLLAAGEGGTDLPSLAAARLGMSFTEGEDKAFQEAEAIWSLREELLKELHELHLERVYERFELPLIPVLADMENTGILIDRPYFQGLSEDFRKDKERLEREMRELAGVDFNPGSSQQLANVLFEVLKLPTKGIKRGKTGISTAASEMEKLEGAHPIIEKVGEYREVAKLLSTYVETLPQMTDKDGRIHTTYKQTVAATGRLSSIDPNLQNIPIRTESGRKIRRGFIASKGNVLLSCDYSQIQLRIVAALAKDEKMLSAFRKKLDIHTATAAEIWGVSMEEVTRDQRSAAKTINFGVLYGQGPNALAKQAGISFAEAKEFIQQYFTVYSGVREYLDTIKALAHAQKYVETLFGRRRPMTDIDSPLPFIRAAAERMAMNMPIQGTEADIMKLALIEVAGKLPSISAESRMLLQVHDELVLEVPEKEVEQVAKQVTQLMEGVADIGCPIVAEAKYGKNWEDMTKIKL